MLKKIAVFLYFVFLFLHHDQAIQGAGEFNSKYDVTYNIQEDGTAQIDEQITLTNLLTNLYPKKSDIILGSANIFNISAYDDVGKIYIKINKENEQTKVSAEFNDKNVGIGKKYSWHLKYETNDLVSLNGVIKEITIPKIDNDPDISDYTLRLNVPISYGPILYVKPIKKDVLVFNKDELSKQQISVAFGKYQIFNYRLKYSVSGNSITPSITEIALPPDTPYQKIFLKSLDPKPLNVDLDQDGNWIAKYQLTPGQKLDILATGSAQIFLEPRSNSSLTTNFAALKTWQQEQKYWNISDGKIMELANILKTPDKIYDYVLSNLHYDYNRVINNPDRLGALNALKYPDNAICTEFTDLFISIARSAGIPARENDGFAYTNNEKLKPLSLKKDILHAWPEFYDESIKNWRQIDPTWANTTGGSDFYNTFDLNHFTFVKRGKYSDYPYPAGAYKNKNESKDIEVEFGNEQDLVDIEDMDLTLFTPDSVIGGFRQEAKVIINNRGNVMIPGQFMTVDISNAELVSKPSIEVGPIPPYGSKEIKIEYQPNNWANEKSVGISVYYNNTSKTTSVLIKKVSNYYLLAALGIFFIICFIIFLIIKYAKNHHR